MLLLYAAPCYLLKCVTTPVYIYHEDFVFCTPNNYCFYFLLYIIDQSTGVDNGVDESEFRNILLTVVHCFPQYKDRSFAHPFFANVDQVKVNELKVLFRKNKRKFFHKKNTGKPRYSLKVDSEGEVVTGFTALPVLLYYIYDRKTDEQVACKEFLSKDMIVPALDWLHQTEGPNGIRTCHPLGMSRLTYLFNERFYFKGNTAIIRDYLKKCPTCKVNNPMPATVPPPPKPIRTYRPHSRLQIDLIDMAPRKRSFMLNNKWNFRYIVSVKCCFSKFCWLFPIQNKSADEIYAVLYVLFQKEGCPDILQSDNGSEFIAGIITKVCNDFGVRIVHGRPHHPQSQGQIENQKKVIKRHLARYLHKMSQKAQASSWPVLLSFVSDVINNTPSTTTNDIPFRLYKNREPRSVFQCFVPEDEIVDISMKEIREDDFTFSDEDFSDIELLQSAEEVELLESTNQVSATAIVQTCAGVLTPLFSNRKVAAFSQGQSKFKSSDISSGFDCLGQDDSVESEFDLHTFNSALLQINNEWNVTQLKALEATEHTIHRNILHSLNKCKGKEFKIGDKVILCNPKLNLVSGLHHQSSDPFCPHNVIGVITNKLPGGMFQVKNEDGDDVVVRSVFAGQMVLFSENNESAEEKLSPCAGEQVSIRQVLEAVSEFAFSVRKEMYHKKLKISSTQPSRQVGVLFDRLYQCLDYGVLATLFALVGDDVSANHHHDQFSSELASLQKEGFRYFFYGTICWEGHRKLDLGHRIGSFLSSVNSREGHDCVGCLSGLGTCKHGCCQNLAFKFAAKCGLVELGDDGVLRLHEVTESKKRSAEVEDKKQPNKKRKKHSQTCQCSDSCTKKPATCGFHRDCCLRLGRQCLINTHKKPSKGNKCMGNSKQDPIDADTQDTSIPQFNFNVSLDEVWQKRVSDDTVVAEQYGCSVTTHDLLLLKPNTWVNDVIIDYIGKDLMAECKEVFVGETLLVECLRNDQYSSCLPEDFNPHHYKKFAFPVHDEVSRNHWWCILVDLSTKQYIEYDPMFTDRKDELLFVRFQIWFLKNVQLDISGYSRLTLKDRANLPTQRGNSSECGIFMLSFIAQSCCGGDFGFTLKDMPVIRRQFGEFILMSGRPSGMPTVSGDCASKTTNSSYGKSNSFTYFSVSLRYGSSFTPTHFLLPRNHITSYVSVYLKDVAYSRWYTCTIKILTESALESISWLTIVFFI